MKYKKGQWLERLDNNSDYLTKGECYKVTGIIKSGTVYIKDDGGCSYGLDKADVYKYFKPAPKTLKTLEVGDVVIDKRGDERVVLEVLDNCFAFSLFSEPDQLCAWRTFKEAEAAGWTIKGAEPQDDKMQEAMNLLKENGYKVIKE